MTTRIPWAQGLIAGTCLTVVACSAQSDASVAATGVTPFVCDTRSNSGQCTDLVVQQALPETDEEVHHLAKKNKFLITYDGTTYGVAFKSKDWLPGFLGAAPLTWVEGEDLMEYQNCTSTLAPQMHATVQVKGVTKPKFSYFMSRKIPVHLNDTFTAVEEHTWYIFPLKAAPTGKTAYCLKFKLDSAGADGGSHDGAVHAQN